MNGPDLKAFRLRQGWSQRQLAELIQQTLDRKPDAGSIGKWENGKRPVPSEVSAFLDTLELQASFPLEDERPPLEGEHLDEGAPDDSVPPPPPGSQPQGQLPLIAGSDPRIAKVCEELWEMVATGVGMVGAVTGSQTLRSDGEIILADKEALGQAYGKLAMTNATFRRMLTSMTSGGAWLEVALVSGITGGKLMRNHQEAAKARREEALRSAEGEVVHGDDDNLGGLAAVI